MKNKIKFQINTIKEEKQIVEMTRKDVDFFKKHKIRITWPENTTVKKKYDKERYQEEMKKIKKKWEEVNEKFIEKVANYFDNKVGKLRVKVSAYGPMGFYDTETNTITINFNNNKPVQTIKHEIVHIMIEKTKKIDKIEYTKKEKIVNEALSSIEGKNSNK
jgi:hypothetical protein